MKTKHYTNKLDKIIRGLNIAADTVKSTMGGQGKTVIIATNDPQQSLRFTKDGVSVAKSISLEDPLENVGAQILISAANKTVEECGDGTTLTSLLLQAMVKEVRKSLTKNSDINQVLSKVEDSVAKVISKLREETIKIESINDVKNITKVSANSERIGELFKEIYEQTGLDARLYLEKSENFDYTYYEVVKGISFDSGYIHSSFMTNKDTEQAIYEDAYIHISTEPLTRLTPEYEKLLSLSIQEQIPVIVIAPRFSDAFMRSFSMNKVNQGAQVCLIKIPGYGYGQKKNIEDIRAFLNEEGYVDKIMIDSYKFVLYNADTPLVEKRVEQLRKLIESTTDKYDAKDYEERIYRLKGASAIIYAGGKTSIAQKEEYDRLEDSIGAVRTAIESGYVLGGGLSLTKIALTEKLYAPVKNSILTPMAQICKNANVEEVNIDVNDLKGYNVKTHQYENFLESGIIDPTEVIISALKNSFTNTKLLINTSYTLYNEYTKNPF